jgi:hypothetical protein
MAVTQCQKVMTTPSLTQRPRQASLGWLLLRLLNCVALAGGPEYLKLGRKVVYRRSDLAKWLNARVVANTTEAANSLPRRLTDYFGD